MTAKEKKGREKKRKIKVTQETQTGTHAPWRFFSSSFPTFSPSFPKPKPTRLDLGYGHMPRSAVLLWTILKQASPIPPFSLIARPCTRGCVLLLQACKVEDGTTARPRELSMFFPNIVSSCGPYRCSRGLALCGVIARGAGWPDKGTSCAMRMLSHQRASHSLRPGGEKTRDCNICHTPPLRTGSLRANDGPVTTTTTSRDALV
ncbi:hypothetical protein LZ31DRAFT_160283 [Colletotrichum somersetense]|nr:hypothetical protein LZ31DRAFT_160283 [Colletotrichum somersetense]